MRRQSIALFLCACAALGAPQGDFERELEVALERKTAEPLWIETTFAQAREDIQQACGANMTPHPPSPAGQAFRRIVESLVISSGRHTIEVLFIDCRLSISALTFGATIVVSKAWLSRATEDDLWAVAAHELAHRPSDFSRRVVIAHHLARVSARDKMRLDTVIETKADAGAVALLQAAGRDPNVVQRFLHKELRAEGSAQSWVRILAFR